VGEFTIHSPRNSIGQESRLRRRRRAGPPGGAAAGPPAGERPLCMHNSAALCTHNACGGRDAIVIEPRRDSVRWLAISANVKVG
jgi:hypothetical protein